MLSRVLTIREQLVIAGLASAVLVGAIVVYAVEGGNRGESEAGLGSAPVSDDPVPAPLVESVVVPPVTIPAAELVPHPANEPPQIAVSAQGAIHKPGLYHLPEGALVQDLIELAGGVLDHANVEDINLAAPLINSTTLTIPAGPVREMREGTLVLHGGENALDLNPARYTVSGWRNGASISQATTATTSPAAATAASASSGGRIDLNRADSAALETLPGIGPKLAGEIIRSREVKPFQSVDDLTEVSGIGPKRLEAIREFVTVNGIP